MMYVGMEGFHMILHDIQNWMGYLVEVSILISVYYLPIKHTRKYICVLEVQTVVQMSLHVRMEVVASKKVISVMVEYIANLACDKDEFSCLDKSKCIKLSLFCNWDANCRDGSDEIRRNLSSEHNTSLVCRIGQNICLIPPGQFAKLKETCNKNVSCPDQSIPCRDGSGCYKYTEFCDGQKICEDGSDEMRIGMDSINDMDGIPCRSYSGKLCLLPLEYLSNKDKLCQAPTECTHEEFTCSDGSNCIPLGRYCSGWSRCDDYSDQRIYTEEEEVKGRILCDAQDEEYAPYKCLLPKRHRCDSIVNCVDGIDECLCSESDQVMVFVDNKCFRCPGNSHIIIPISKLCDGVFDCPNLSDECLCNKRQRLRACQRVTWDASGILKFTCEAVGNHKKIELVSKQICDERVDCVDKIDEIHCSKHESIDDTASISTDKDLRPFKCSDGTGATACDRQPECIGDIYYEECDCDIVPRFCRFVDVLPPDGYHSGRTPESHINNYYEGSAYIYNQFFCSDKNKLDGPQICDGEKNCLLEEDEVYCDHRFYCKSGSVIHIQQEKVCDQIPDCDDHSDEIRESGCSFKCNDGGDVEYIDLTQVCDGLQNCAQGSDECLDECIKSAFSSAKSMIKSKGVVAIVWIISFTALFGNLLVAGMSIRDLSSSKRRSGTASARINKALILNLSFADFLVGVYTVSICIQNSLFDGKYCLVDGDWRTSDTCSALGAILVIGSEESVFTMILITAFKMICIWRPSSMPSMRTLWLTIAFTWIISISFALIPISPSLEDYFVDSIWYSDNRLFSSIERSEVPNFVNWLMVMYEPMNRTISVQKRDSWRALETLIGEMFPMTTPKRKFGFYSTHTVCLPTLFPNRLTDTAWWYSLIIILLNFLGFCFMLFGYTAVYRKVTTQRRHDSLESTSELSSKMQKKLTRILVTDFCCWMPVCIAAFVQLSGIDIPTDTYLPFGLIVIPINSALNPFLYSSAPDLIWTKLRPLRSWMLINCAEPILRICHLNTAEVTMRDNVRPAASAGMTQRETLAIFSEVANNSQGSGNEMEAETTV